MATSISTPTPPSAAFSGEESRAGKLLRETFESGRPLTYIRTTEEQRVERLLAETAARMGRQAVAGVWSWSSTEGLRPSGQPAAPDTQSPRGALDFIAAHPASGIFLLKDFHGPLRDEPDVRRRLRDIYYRCLDQGKYIVITSAVRFVPEELQRSIVFIELRTPDVHELTDFLRSELPRMAPLSQHAAINEDLLALFAPALRGLTLEEAGYAVRRAVNSGVPLGPESLPAIRTEKQLLISRSGVIEYIGDSRNLDEIGGLDNLKLWLTERRKLFQLRDDLSSEIVPKGLLLMGIPGCGKSLCVKAISSCFQLPLYRIDMIEIFSGRHGKPEGVFVETCRMMEEMAPAVLWFDEIEMGVTSTESAGEQGRIFAFFLTWMQEKTPGLFVAATANRLDLLPAEMIRKGRFDEVFFVDMPIESEQIDIFKIHLKRRGVDCTGFDFAQLVKFTNGWTGAEIEQCVISAITKAKLAERPVTERDLILIAAKFVPLSRTMKEQIGQIRAWAFDRAIRATPNPQR
ncbi:MAG TPA: AAA family ATPase [Bryobacteraceae bacterium]|nr:AAA family ATPase [Bryobacteraceae bacterium]